MEGSTNMGGSQTFKRKEMKYQLTLEQKENFLSAIQSQIQPDPFPRYTICNVYMDTPDSRLIRRSIEKPAYKEKIRLRSYGMAGEDKVIFVELKKKFDGIVYKRRIKMRHEEAIAYIGGEASRCGQIESEIDYFIEHYQGIGPAMHISYDREAYHGVEDSSLRITFDNNIRWRDNDVSLGSEIYGDRILNQELYILEIKCAGSMPLWLARALSENKIYKNSFSKYGKAYLIQQQIDEREIGEYHEYI